MALDWPDPAIASLAGGRPRLVVLLRIGSDPPVRVWAGVGDLEIDADNVEMTAGAIYSGMGELSGLPVVQQVINGHADRVDFSVAGAVLTQRMLEMASTEAASIRGAIANIGLMVLGGDLQPISPVDWLCDLECDVLGVALDGAADEGPAIRSISVSAATVTSGRRRARSLLWTDPDQQRESPGDLFCSQVASYSAGTTRVWPI
jgi:hypothetical protein